MSFISHDALAFRQRKRVLHDQASAIMRHAELIHTFGHCHAFSHIYCHAMRYIIRISRDGILPILAADINIELADNFHTSMAADGDASHV